MPPISKPSFQRCVEGLYKSRSPFLVIQECALLSGTVTWKGDQRRSLGYLKSPAGHNGSKIYGAFLIVALHSVHKSLENSTNKGELLAWVGLVFWIWITLEGLLAYQAAGSPNPFRLLMFELKPC